MDGSEKPYGCLGHVVPTVVCVIVGLTNYFLSVLYLEEWDPNVNLFSGPSDIV